MSDTDSDSNFESDSDKDFDIDGTLESFQKAREMKLIVKTLQDKNLFFWRYFSVAQEKISLLRSKANALDYALKNKFQSEDCDDIPAVALRNIYKKGRIT
ncbi:hypothetical protein TNCT_502351 [Trichonephila clavata]|uniref:Uncharacterized protein n=1 Tax=Trichonephila clavata TaxID=2740835 RepID=A0A8X6HWJ6_TRICU|nr:hypothetical protein TNCT_502351 [Trichonephila clavata]